MRSENDKNGFSLIELIIAISILVILTGLLAPQFMKYIEKSRQVKMMQKLDTIYFSIQTAYIDIMENGNVDDEEKIKIELGTPSNGNSLFEEMICSLLKESIGEAELEHLSFSVDTTPEGGTLEEDFHFNNVMIQYYPNPEDRKTYYYFRKGYDREGSENWAAFCPGTYGEMSPKGVVSWK